MATPVVITGKLTTPDGVAVAAVTITATLNVLGAVTDNAELVNQTTATTATDGTYALTLYKNADLLPANTYYTISLAGEAGLRIVVTGAGTVEAMVVSSAPLPTLAIPESQVMGLEGDLGTLTASVAEIETDLGEIGALQVTDEASITANAAAIALKAPLASPTFTGTVTVPASVNLTDAVQKLDLFTEQSRATAAEALKVPLLGSAKPAVTVSPISGAIANNGAQYGPDTAGTTTSGIQEAIASLPTASIIDSWNLTVTGPVGRISLLGGVFMMTGTVSVGACNLVIDGAGSSHWNPNGTGTASTRRQGTLVYSTANAAGQGCFKTVLDANGQIASNLVIRDVDFALLSPAAANWANPPAVDLTRWQTGEIANVQVAEITAAGGVGNNLYIVFDVEPGAGGGLRVMRNCQGCGGNIGLALHLAGGQITSCGGSNTAGTLMGGADAGVMIIDDLHTFYENIYGGTATYGFLLTPYGYGQPFTPLVINRPSFEAVNHYMRSGGPGTVIFNSPSWDTALDPSTDIAAQLSADTRTYSIPAGTGMALISRDDQDPHSRGITRHVTVPPQSWTAGTSPYAMGPLPFDVIFVLITAGGISALTLDGQALSMVVGTPIHVGAGHQLVATWATTAPIFRVLPL